MIASFSPADAISDPKALGTGLAAIPHTREATLIQLSAGLHSYPNRSSTGLADSPTASREANLIHPGLVALHGSASILETPVAASAALLLDREPCGCALSPFERSRTFFAFTNRDQLGREAVRDGAQSLPCFLSLHGHNHDPEPFHEARIIGAKSGTRYARR